MPDDTAWPTQTFVLGELGRLVPHAFTMDDIFNYTYDHYEECGQKIFNISYWGTKNGSGQVLVKINRLIIGNERTKCIAQGRIQNF